MPPHFWQQLKIYEGVEGIFKQNEGVFETKFDVQPWYNNLILFQKYLHICGMK
jgi:hypothetical protein